MSQFHQSNATSRTYFPSQSLANVYKLSLDLPYIHLNSIVGLAHIFQEQELSDNILQTEIIGTNRRKWHSTSGKPSAGSKCFPAIFWACLEVTGKKALHPQLKFWISPAVCHNERTTRTFHHSICILHLLKARLSHA